MRILGERKKTVSGKHSRQDQLSLPFEVLSSFRSVLEIQTSEQILETPRLKFVEKISAKNLALKDADHSTSGPLN